MTLARSLGQLSRWGPSSSTHRRDWPPAPAARSGGWVAARAGCWASRGEGGTGNSPPRWAVRNEPLRHRGLPDTSCPCAGLCRPDTVPRPHASPHSAAVPRAGQGMNREGAPGKSPEEMYIQQKVRVLLMLRKMGSNVSACGASGSRAPREGARRRQPEGHSRPPQPWCGEGLAGALVRLWPIQAPGHRHQQVQSCRPCRAVFPPLVLSLGQAGEVF